MLKKLFRSGSAAGASGRRARRRQPLEPSWSTDNDNLSHPTQISAETTMGGDDGPSAAAIGSGASSSGGSAAAAAAMDTLGSHTAKVTQSINKEVY